MAKAPKAGPMVDQGPIALTVPHWTHMDKAFLFNIKNTSKTKKICYLFLKYLGITVPNV